MKLAKTITDLENLLAAPRSNAAKIGFVPTMGALHNGHISLIDEARKSNDIVVCSIFVNPTQFNNKEDLDRYPRHFAEDEALLKSRSCDILFAPIEKEMYPEMPEESTEINFGELDTILEGKFRPGHFAGVATIVRKFFEIVRPDNAYFGEKDYQQLMIIKKMVSILGMNVNIIPCPIVREESGLAMSSRNALLNEEERKEACSIFQTLQQISNLKFSMSVKELKDFVMSKYKFSKTFRLEYFEIVDAQDFSLVTSWDQSKQPIACIAIFLGKIRLIDNIKLFS